MLKRTITGIVLVLLASSCADNPHDEEAPIIMSVSSVASGQGAKVGDRILIAGELNMQDGHWRLEESGGTAFVRLIFSTSLQSDEIDECKGHQVIVSANLEEGGLAMVRYIAKREVVMRLGNEYCYQDYLNPIE